MSRPMREIYHLSEQVALVEDHMRELASGSAGCPDCMWKHLNKIVGYAHEVVTLSESEEMKNFYSNVADEARIWRKAIFEVESNPESTLMPKVRDNPGIPEHCEFSKEPVKHKDYFDKDSFRTLCPESPTGLCKDLPPELACATRVIIGCKEGEFVKGKCRVGTEAHVILHGRG